MPYICLTKPLANGTVQVLDLKPNTSQANTSVLRNGAADATWLPHYETVDGHPVLRQPTTPAQSKYVNRVQNKTVQLGATGMVLADCEGLSAYLVDRVEVGGLDQAATTVTCAAVEVDDTVTISGVVFKAVLTINVDHTKAGTVGDPILFDQGNGGTTAATGLKAALDAAGVIAKLKTAIGGNKFVAAAVTDAIVTLSARDGASALLGVAGDAITVASSNATRLACAAARLTRRHEFWTPALQGTVSAALIAHMDAGLALDLASINAGLASLAGAELTTSGGSRSVGTVADILSIMAGRGFRLLAFPFESTTPNAKFTNSHTWSATTHGSFTRSVRKYDKDRSKTFKGPVSQVEIKPIRATLDTGAFQISLAQGHLYQLTRTGTVIVYADDGSVLS